MKERQGFNFSELEIQPGRIGVRDNRGIETKEGLVDILVDTKLLEGDILAAVERQSPQFLEKAVNLIDNLHFYLGKRPLVEVLLEELASRDEASEETLRVFRRLLQARELVTLGATNGVFYANEKCPFFYFNTPKMVRDSGKKNFPNKLKEGWLHERQHFVDFLDPVRYEQLMKDQEEKFIFFGIIEGLGGVTFTLGIGYAVFKEEAEGRKISRRAVLKAGLGGVVMGGVMSLTFSPVAYMISSEFTYSRSHASEKAARQTAKEGILIRPFEEIFQIKFHS